MSDIVERLREAACWDPDRPHLPTGPLAAQLLEAADEIELLRKNNHFNYNDETGVFLIYCEDGYCVCCGNGKWKAHMPGCEVADMRDEIERLRGECEGWKRQCLRAQTEFILRGAP